MKKLLITILILLSVTVFVSCDRNPTTVSNRTTLQTTMQEDTATTTAATTAEATTTSTDVTTLPITTNSTTTFPMTTTYQDTEIVLNYLSGVGTLTKPYKLTLTEGESTTYQIGFTPANSDVVYEEGQLIDGIFTANQPETASGLDLAGSNLLYFSVEALLVGTFCVRITANDMVSIYVLVEVKEIAVDFSKTLKVLAIGNSFSVDGMEYLYKIADSYGVEEIILGNLYIGGASLATHVNSITNNLNNYVYYKNTADVWTYNNSSSTLLYGLLDEDWDIITIQQVSGSSGVPSTYNSDLDFLINYVNEHKTNERAKLGWHMTWAYQADSTHPSFPTYSSNQMTMYNAIISTVQSEIVLRDDMDFVIPSGTAIQNLRTSFIGDTLTRDGYHLSNDIGRYTAALTWFKEITGFSINFVLYKPDGITLNQETAIREAVNNAIAHPYAITESIYK